MRLCIGDLVSGRWSNGHSIGLIISAGFANDKTFSVSEHSKALAGSFPSVYYVLFPGTGVCGPYFTTELILEQDHGFVSR
jgi:hypothetical protein